MQERVEHAQLVAAVVEHPRDFREHLVELGHREVASGHRRRTALSGLLVEAEFLTLDARGLGQPLAECVQAQDARLQLAHPHRQRVEVVLHLRLGLLDVVLVEGGEKRAKVGVAQVDGELHRHNVGRHRQHEARQQDAESDQQHLRL